jgi:hypothetical protein
MSNRSWFFGSLGQQKGPYSEAQLRDLIATGIVTAATLVWSEGMAGWQKAGISRACSRAIQRLNLMRGDRWQA